MVPLIWQLPNKKKVLINKVKNFIKLFSIITLICLTAVQTNSAETSKLLKTDWSFKGLFGKFDRGSL